MKLSSIKWQKKKVFKVNVEEKIINKNIFNRCLLQK